MTLEMPDGNGIHPWIFTWTTTTWHCVKLEKFFAQNFMICCYWCCCINFLLLLLLLLITVTVAVTLTVVVVAAAAVPLHFLKMWPMWPKIYWSQQRDGLFDSRIELSRSGGWVRRFVERISWAPRWQECDALPIWLKVGRYILTYCSYMFAVVRYVVVTYRFAWTCRSLTVGGQNVLYNRRVRGCRFFFWEDMWEKSSHVL